MGKNFQDFLNEQLQNAEVKKEYDALEVEYQIISALIEARNKQNLTQKQLAQITGIVQGNISRLEKGTLNPSIKTLKRLADGLNMKMRINFEPK